MTASAREIAERGMFLRATVGSTLHGLHHAEQDDRDEMGICLEPAEYVVGLATVRGRGRLHRSSEHYVERTQPDGARSGPGDLDLVVYSLRKWMRLAVAGNPTVLLLLFAPEAYCHVLTPLGRELQALAPAIVSRAAGPRFLGYLRSQKERLVGERGQMRVKRPELIDAHGFDTKYAMHVVRLGYQGRELLTTGRLTLPMAEPERGRVMSIRRGEVRADEVLDEIERLEADLAALAERSPLRAAPDRAAIDRFLVRAYAEFWGFELPPGLTFEHGDG